MTRLFELENQLTRRCCELTRCSLSERRAGCTSNFKATSDALAHAESEERHRTRAITESDKDQRPGLNQPEIDFQLR